MVCLHCLDSEKDTETNKNGLYRIVWRCSYCTETDTNTDSHWVWHAFYRYLCWSLSRWLYLVVECFAHFDSDATNIVLENWCVVEGFISDDRARSPSSCWSGGSCGALWSAGGSLGGFSGRRLLKFEKQKIDHFKINLRYFAGMLYLIKTS